MVLYRRNRVLGGTYFFTVALRDRRARTLTDHIDVLRSVVMAAHAEHPFTMDAMVVLPEHLHAVWTLPSGDADYAGRWRLIKSRFTRALVKAGVQLSPNARGEYNLWQRRYWEHTIRDETDLARHVEYIHFNPVKHGLVRQVRDWPHSTFHRYVRQGLCPADWAGADVENEDAQYGE
ncbi:MAG: REP-associated tyrosine transposase [Desulfobulbaceae bacterium]